MTRVLVAFAAGVVAIAVGVTAAMSEEKPRLAGTNSVTPFNFIIFTENRRPACQSGEVVPRGAAALEMTIGNFGAPTEPLEATVVKDGRTITRGVLRRGWREGVVRLPIRPVATTVTGATVCVRSAARGRLAFGGREGKFRIAYLRAGRESWFDVTGAVTHRFGLAKAGWQGSWTIGLAAALILAALALSLWAMLRQARA